jgi:D-glycero-alpha-D-manno-heptose-7-phosphate kinase
LKEAIGSAPTRIDLAGGTVDIWPLYLLTEGALTVNAAIDFHACCRVRARRDGRVKVRSRDLGRRVTRPLERPVKPGEPLELLVRIACTLAPNGGVDLETDCAAPAGSGLGGSSSLAVAAASALNRLAGRRRSRRQLLTLVRDIETQVLGIPAGEQDYYAALFGGAQAIEWGPGGGRRRALDVDLDLLRERCLLCYSGESRCSGASNWDMVRRRLDRDRRTVRALDGIVSAAREMRRALVSGDWKRAGEALGEEMAHRRRMSPLVASGPVGPLLAAGKKAGAWGGKVCGAGGGGCVVFLAPPERIGAIERAVRRGGAGILRFQFARRGATVTSKPTSLVTGAQKPLLVTQ